MSAPHRSGPSARAARRAESAALAVTRAMRSAVCLGALGIVLGGCGLGDGERFGRAGAVPGQLRLRVASLPGDLDPARADGFLERAIATQLFATLLEPDGRPRLAREATPSADGKILTLRLHPDARFSDGTPVDADAVLWSWRRALLRSTGTRDLRAFAAIAHGAELAEGRLLQVARATTTRGAPFTRLGLPPAAPASAELLPGTAVRVLDSNERRPCCGGSVALRREPDGGDALGALHQGDVGAVIGERTVRGRSFLLIRSASGASGWAEQSLLAMSVPPASLARVVDRGDGSAGLRVGPDEEAPLRVALTDDDVVEILGETEGWLHAVDSRTGQMGFLPQRAAEALRGERQWVLVEAAGEGEGASQRGWVPLRDLAFNPGALGARALDARTLEIDCAAPVAAVLAALAEPALAPVPAHLVAAHGRAWTQPETLVTTGPFLLAPAPSERRILVRNPAALEAPRVRLQRVELISVRDPIAALHLYRAGELDVLPEGPVELASLLSRASDWVPTMGGGGLVAPEVRGLALDRLDLREVEVVAP